MVSSLWNGISGLNTFEKALNVESNNTSNVNTTGHKSDQIRFEDMMYKNGFGKGTAVEAVSKNYTQGQLQPTTSAFDVAIEGKGYFIIKDPDTQVNLYTRSGNFQLGNDGTLQTQDSSKVLGLTPQLNTVISSDPTLTQFTNVHDKFIASATINNLTYVETINSKTSDYTKSATDGGISGDGYKSKSAKINDIDALMLDYNSKLNEYSKNPNVVSAVSSNQITAINYSNEVDNLLTENDFIKVTINNTEIKQYFDTDKETTLKKFSDKLSNIKGLTSSVDTNTGIVTVTSLVPGESTKIFDSSINDKGVIINNIQNANKGSGELMVTNSRDALKEALELADAKFMSISNKISLVNQDDLNLNEIQLQLRNLTLTENTFGIVSIEEGFVFLRDGDNKFLVGKVETAYFSAEDELDPLGNNNFGANAASGDPINARDVNVLHSKTLEASNSNVRDSLTNLMIYQKAFEANSKSITTSDELLKTAIALRK
ncbi:MAG: flagellar hook-basal body complex protein [Poseidonibacter sp.]|uniref:flagellar hook-basal body complex protein n=1 Tax=Poseidonibacter sp. TaxID=2321188 RepID=UPI00359DC2E9